MKTIKVLLLGATGKTGRVLTERLKNEPGISLTAYVRSPEKLGDIGNVHIIKGDVTDGVSLSEAMKGQDIIVTALSGDTILQQAESVVAAMRKTGVRRILWMTGMGIHHEVPGITGKMLDMLVRSQPEYVRAADTIAESGMEYTLLRGAHLTDGKNKSYRIQREGERLHANTADRAAIAEFIVSIVKDPEQYKNESIGITN